MSEVPKTCPNVDKCPLFPLFSTTMLLRVFQAEYCEYRYAECARLQSMQRGVKPERELLPDGSLLVLAS